MCCELWLLSNYLVDLVDEIIQFDRDETLREIQPELFRDLTYMLKYGGQLIKKTLIIKPL